MRLERALNAVDAERAREIQSTEGRESCMQLGTVRERAVCSRRKGERARFISSPREGERALYAVPEGRRKTLNAVMERESAVHSALRERAV